MIRHPHLETQIPNTVTHTSRLPLVENIDLTFNAIAQSTPLNILNQGPSRIEPEVQPVIPAQLFLSHTFVIGDIHPAADHGPIIPENLVAKGYATGKSRRTVLWEQTLPGVNA